MARFKPGEVLRVTKLVNDNDTQIEDDAWGVVLDDEDMMLFIKRERIYGSRGDQSHDGWSSRVCPIGWADEDTQVAAADEVPQDVPADFWALSARLTLA
jgi:hypothetical protein